MMAERDVRGRVVELARGWLGTPYHHQASVKGVGADCLGLVRGVYRELYGHEAETPPSYSADWAEAAGEESMLLAAARHLRPVRPARARPGDVLVFRLRRGFVAKHAAIMSAPGRMIHAVEGAPVCEVHLSNWWRRRIARAFVFPAPDQRANSR